MIGDRPVQWIALQTSCMSKWLVVAQFNLSPIWTDMESAVRIRRNFPVKINQGERDIEGMILGSFGVLLTCSTFDVGSKPVVTCKCHAETVLNV
jgi:hypothetical protein